MIIGVDIDINTSIYETNIFSIYIPYFIIGYFIFERNYEVNKSYKDVIIFILIFMISIFYIAFYSKKENHYDIIYYHFITLMTSYYLLSKNKFFKKYLLMIKD
ncbi:hypothetical protein [Helcococcus ovis]|nr:hypothetical protein [Helcococcus ovis]